MLQCTQPSVSSRRLFFCHTDRQPVAGQGLDSLALCLYRRGLQAANPGALPLAGDLPFLFARSLIPAGKQLKVQSSARCGHCLAVDEFNAYSVFGL